MTPHQGASLELVSDTKGDAKPSLDPVGAFDTDSVIAALDDLFAGQPDPQSLQSRAVEIIDTARKSAFNQYAAMLAAKPRNARAVTDGLTRMTDGVVLCVYHAASTYLTPDIAVHGIAVLGVGGYGRHEMAPYSDVDLLFLLPTKSGKAAETLIETMLYMLWDMRLKVGHATRTVRDCLRLGKQDFTIRTALLEKRFIVGTGKLAQELQDRLRTELFQGTEAEFIEAKLEERAERHRKQGGNRYMVEPNVKEGKGGLRDLQSLFWIAKYARGVSDPAELVAMGVFSKAEFQQFRRAEQFLWAVRCHLHLFRGRAAEQLTFDAQVEVAARMKYRDGGGRRAVEHFMQDYFRHATRVGDLTRIFLTALEAQHVKQQPRVAGFLRRTGQRLRVKLAPGFKIDNGRLNVEDRAFFAKDPVNMLRVFEEALRTNLLLHPDIMRQIAAKLPLIDDHVRADPEANAIFLRLLIDYGNPERALRRMNELGVLGAFLPEFQPIVAMMQFNMYHHYTVDEHSIQCIRNLAEIERGNLVEDLPVASEILRKGVNRRVIYLAVLLHDIGKGRDEDHSILGARLAADICPRLGLEPEECDLVEWLVRHHLLMSDAAQKRDLSDPRTVRDFARLVGSRTRLKLLTVLTVCDIRGVGPGVWNNWKAQLLRELYRSTREALTGGLENFGTTGRDEDAKAALRNALPDWPQDKLQAELDRHYAPYWMGLNTETQALFARLLDGLGEDEIRADIEPDPDRDATRACFALADHPGIFTRLSGAVALVGANVVDARTYTSSDGFATAVFWIQDGSGKPYEQSRLPRLRAMIDKTLKGQVVARDALEDRDRIKTRERDFLVPTEITFDNEGSEIYTIIEVDTRDRPGLLYDLARAISSANVYVASAVIATYGAQAVDVFYVKDMFGLKMHAQSKRDALERRIREAIEKGAERALS